MADPSPADLARRLVEISRRLGDTEATSPPQEGATIKQRYLHRSEDTVGVAMTDLEEFKTASFEEFGQFVFGNFLVSGAFWLGIERAVTVTAFWNDLLFWVCVVCVIAGGVITFFGFRQLRRRQTRIDRIIASAKQELEANE